MHFTPALAASILAFSSGALAKPVFAAENAAAAGATGTAAPAVAATSTTSIAAQPTATGASPLAGLSKTQQIFLSDTRADAINNVLKDDKDFVFNFQKAQKGGPGKGGEIVAANRKTFPALTNTRISGAVGFLGACGFNTPHVHPRATELLFVVSGSVVASTVPENGVVDAAGKPREILNTLAPFDTTVLFQGSVHSQFNPACEPAVFFAALSADDPGTGQIAQELFAASNKEATAAVFGSAIEGADVDKLKGAISANVALGVETCLKKCNIQKRK